MDDGSLLFDLLLRSSKKRVATEEPENKAPPDKKSRRIAKPEMDALKVRRERQMINVFPYRSFKLWGVPNFSLQQSCIQGISK